MTSVTCYNVTMTSSCLGDLPAKDILGRQFGDLTVTAYDGNREGTYFWRCRCKCGREAVVRQSNLLLGHTKSCGCRQRVISTNSSGYNGVYRNRKNGKWIAQITFKART